MRYGVQHTDGWTDERTDRRINGWTEKVAYRGGYTT